MRLDMTSTNPTRSPLALRKDGDIEQVLTRADPNLGRLIGVVVARAGVQRPAKSKATPFQALVRAVVYQSVAAEAAAAIYTRLRGAVSGPLTPLKIIRMTEGALRKVGVSSSKARAIHALADWFIANRSTARNIAELPDDAVAEALTVIPGIGVWTVNVFLIFNLQRLDVMPTADLGIRRGVQLIDRLDQTPGPKEVRERALRWRPYRSIASMYLWHVVRLKITADDLTRTV
jgi:DNA-3-methyladenine glycosylase II